MFSAIKPKEITAFCATPEHTQYVHCRHKLAYFISMFSILAHCCKGPEKKWSHLSRWLLSSSALWAAV